MATPTESKPAAAGPTVWERTKGYSSTAYEKALKPGFNKAYAVVDKLGNPVNRLSNKVGAEAFWPTTMDKESEKAARILRGFCKDGFYEQVDANDAKRIESRESRLGITQEGVPQGKQRVFVKIPTKVIQECKALAIFTTMRTGWLFGGSGGAGIMVARHPETGEWSPPSGIQTQNLSFGFLAGVDIYDTVLVINSYKALEAFTKVRCTLGTEIGVAAGPMGIGGALDAEVRKRQAMTPIWSYVKSRGLYAGIALEGNLVIERTDENAKFYGYEYTAQDIFAHKVLHPPTEQYQVLMDTLKAAQGEVVDDSLLPVAGVAPSDMELDTDGPGFGIPDVEDPDPFGVKALEAEGLLIREAGTHQRPSAEAFEFKPSPSSPIYGHFSRKSVDSSMTKSKTWRDSTASFASVDRGVQTEDDESPHRRESRHMTPPIKEDQNVTDTENRTESPIKETQTVTDSEHHTHTTSPNPDPDPDRRDSLSHRPSIDNDRDHDHDESFSDIDSDVEIHTATPAITKARVVSVPKRVPPALPPRNPGRVGSPLADTPPVEGFEQVSLNGAVVEDSQSRTSEEKKTASLDSNGNDKEGRRLSRATSDGEGGEDRFQSMPGTPTVEKEEEKVKVTQ